MPGLKKHQRDILIELERAGGTATVRLIAERLDLDVNGVSQSLGARSMAEYVEQTGNGTSGDREWHLKKPLSDAPRLFT